MRHLLLRTIAVLLCSAAMSSAARAETVVSAQRKATDKPKQYPTRLLGDLSGFSAGTVKLDKFGGWNGDKSQATGFFYAKKIGDRWWLIDPEGNRFLHVAICGVTVGHSPENRRTLPQRFGTVENWREQTLRMIFEHGFNGTGAWSDDSLNTHATHRPVYTPILNFMSTFGKKLGKTYVKPGHAGYPNDCILVFHPQFEEFADEHARSLAAWKDDPYLLGYFSDNEMPFPSDSLSRYLELPGDDPGHQAAVQWLAKRRIGKNHAAKPTPEESEAWLGLVADRYFGIVARAIKRYDPNHLYIGSRLHGGDKGHPAIFQAAGKHVDVISYNLYGVWTPDAEMLGNWTRWSGRPVMITEFYAKGQDSGMANTTGAGWLVPTQADRGRFYQTYVLGLLESKVCVGWHWFKYMDNDPQDLSTDPSNRDSNKGIVTAGYKPWTPLLEKMREVNEAVYPLTAWFDRTARSKASEPH